MSLSDNHYAYWWRTDQPSPDGTWPIYNNLSFREEDIVARCVDEETADWIVRHSPGATLLGLDLGAATNQ